MPRGLPVRIVVGMGLVAMLSRRVGAGGSSPLFVSDPVISGTEKEGEVATVSNGVVDGVVTSYTYEWLRDGVTPIGANQNTYTYQYDDVAATITCRVTAENAFGSDDATSAATGAIAQAPELLFGEDGEYWDYEDLEAQGYSDTDPITTWAGRIQGITATSSGSARYTYRADSGGVPGAAEGDGIDDRMSIPDAASWMNPGETFAMVMCVSDMNSGSSLFRYIWSGGNASSATWISAYARFDSNFPFIRRAGTTVDTLFTVTPAAYWSIIQVVEGATGGGARAVDLTCYVSPNASPAIATASGSLTDETAITTLYIGCRAISDATNLGFFFEGDLRGFGIKRGVWTATDATRWKRYNDDKGRT